MILFLYWSYLRETFSAIMQSSVSNRPGLTLPNEARTARLLSLDFFRGLTVAAMILVNNPGDWGHIYAPLEHAPWNGWTPTDLIFPFFLFIVGVSITFALGRFDDAQKGGDLARL